MLEPIRILLQTTIRFEADIWASPSFVEEGPQALNDIKIYASNTAR